MAQISSWILNTQMYNIGPNDATFYNITNSSNNLILIILEKRFNSSVSYVEYSENLLLIYLSAMF